MQWLLHGNLTGAVGEAMLRHEQKIHQITETSLAGDAEPAEVVAVARTRQWDILTTDPALCSHLLAGESSYNRSAVFLQLEGEAVEQDDAIDRLFARYKRMAPFRLYTVTATRVKVRQLPLRQRL